MDVAAAVTNDTTTLSPSAPLLLWTLFMILLVVAVAYALVRWILRRRRD
jgi:hypothetical protein